MSVQCVLFSFYEAAQCWAALRVCFRPILWSAGLLISQWFTNPQLFRIGCNHWICLLTSTMQNTNILRRSFEGVFVGLGLSELAWVTIGLIRNRSKGCEDLRRLGVDWLAEGRQALPDQQLTLGTSPCWPKSCPHPLQKTPSNLVRFDCT